MDQTPESNAEATVVMVLRDADGACELERLGATAMARLSEQPDDDTALAVANALASLREDGAVWERDGGEWRVTELGWQRASKLQVAAPEPEAAWQGEGLGDLVIVLLEFLGSR